MMAKLVRYLWQVQNVSHCLSRCGHDSNQADQTITTCLVGLKTTFITNGISHEPVVDHGTPKTCTAPTRIISLLSKLQSSPSAAAWKKA